MARRHNGIYVASRASIEERPAMWRVLRDHGYPISSTWIDEAGPGETASMEELWRRIQGEIRQSRGMILYAEPSDFPLKGAIAEAGMALMCDLPVVIVAPGVEDLRRKLGSWIARAQLADSVEEAFQRLGFVPGPVTVMLTVRWSGGATQISLTSTGEDLADRMLEMIMSRYTGNYTHVYDDEQDRWVPLMDVPLMDGDDPSSRWLSRSAYALVARMLQKKVSDAVLCEKGR